MTYSLHNILCRPITYYRQVILIAYKVAMRCWLNYYIYMNIRPVLVWTTIIKCITLVISLFSETNKRSPKNTTFLSKTKSKPVKKNFKIQLFFSSFKNGQWIKETLLSNTFQVTLGICNLFTCCSVKAV